MEHKTLSSIALQITEEEYRNDGCIHYSTLASYERGGFHSIPSLGEKKESPSLLFGSMVDTILTDGEDVYNAKYFVTSLPECTDAIVNISKTLFERYGSECASFQDLNKEDILIVCDEFSYGKAWKASTRIEKVEKGGGVEYFNLLKIAGDRQIVSDEMNNQAFACVQAIRSSPQTNFLFCDDDNPNIERCFQIKFKSCFNGLWYSMMADLIVVLHDKKIIIPIDLKTSSHYEDEFYKSFVDWGYSIQARQYYRILADNLEKDDYFKDFTILDWHFVAINKNSLIPLVWVFKDTKKTGTLFYGKNSQIMLRDPVDIAEELQRYKDSQTKVQFGIELDSPNSLNEWLATM